MTRPAIWRRAVPASVARSRSPSAASAAAARTEGEQGGNRLEAGAPPRSCSPPTRRGSNLAPAPDDQGAGPGHPTQRVRAQADQVGIERAEVHRDVPARSGGVDVHGDAGLPAECDHLVDRLEGADLVVGPLAVHQGRRRAATAIRGAPRWRRRRPAPPRPRRSSRPARLGPDASRTAECSTAAQSTAPPGTALVAPQTAALIASVAPEVKTTWRGATLTRPATCARATSSASRTMRPSWCSRPGSPGGRADHSVSAAIASGRAGVVLAWSR